MIKLWNDGHLECSQFDKVKASKIEKQHNNGPITNNSRAEFTFTLQMSSRLVFLIFSNNYSEESVWQTTKLALKDYPGEIFVIEWFNIDVDAVV